MPPNLYLRPPTLAKTAGANRKRATLVKIRRSPLIVATAVATLFLSILAALPASAVGKVSYDEVPSAAQNAGTTFTVVFRLDEPIICSDTCTALTLQLASSETATASVSQNNLSWNANQWSETRTITVTVGQSLTYNSASSVRFQGRVQSNSEYYRNYQVTFNVSINTPIKPISIPDPKQLSSITEKPVAVLSDSTTTIVKFNGKFVEQVRAIHLNGSALPTEAWTQSDSLITLRAPKVLSSTASIQIYNGSVPILFDGTFDVIKSPSMIIDSKRVKILCKGKKISRSIYGIAPSCPVGYTLIK